MVSLIQDFEADFLWKVNLKILNSGIILKTFTHKVQHKKTFQCDWKIVEWDVKYQFKQTHVHSTNYILNHAQNVTQKSADSVKLTTVPFHDGNIS